MSEEKGSLLYFGKLRIKGRRTLWSTRNNGVYGPGGKTWAVRGGEETILEIEEGEGRKETINYPGTIDGISEGKNVEVYRFNGRGYKIIETETGRFYESIEPRTRENSGGVERKLDGLEMSDDLEGFEREMKG
jgi:hypothetical protein